VSVGVVKGPAFTKKLVREPGGKKRGEVSMKPMEGNGEWFGDQYRGCARSSWGK